MAKFEVTVKYEVEAELATDAAMHVKVDENVELLHVTVKEVA